MSRVHDKQTERLPNGPINVQSPSLTQFSEPRRRKAENERAFSCRQVAPQKRNKGRGGKGSWVALHVQLQFCPTINRIDGKLPPSGHHATHKLKIQTEYEK